MTPTLPPGFTATAVAHVDGARELAVAPNGDLFIGTDGENVYVVPRAEALVPGAVRVFVHIPDPPVAGVLLADGALYAGGQFGIWRIPYRTGDEQPRAMPEKIAQVRTSFQARGHRTTSLAFAKGVLYASVGSSCNNCRPELDATRATVQAMAPTGAGMHPVAVHIRNAIALAVNPSTSNLWAGVAGQDELAHGHPYEIFDPVTAHRAPADYGWPLCVENRVPTRPGAECSHVVVPRVVFPAYSTPIGAVFYRPPRGALHPFPKAYWGGAFVTLHGSWHRPLVPPRVAFVPMTGDQPARGVDWRDPSVQWRQFAGGFQEASGARTARPTGIAEGPEGDLFLADDQSGTIWRIRYGAP
ncbi:MAG TPA: hypothetical protein VNJ51_10595 [Candidatus Dormibacteraeota bacterium]|nr:hypothetical protein [Candidatus Dormibacteraeota bacterium]